MDRDIRTWADAELDMAIAKEKKEAEAADHSIGSEYMIQIYESARQLIHLLYEQDHSGASAHMTKHIFNKLVDYEPLSPVTDDEDQWLEDTHIGSDSDYKEYQHIRNIGLFKRVYKDGHVEYNDIERVIYSLKLSEEPCWHSGFITHRLNELVPIKFPYSSQHIKVWCDEMESETALLPDALGILRYQIDGGPMIPINEYYRSRRMDDPVNDFDWFPIPKQEFDRLKYRIYHYNNEGAEGRIL